MAMEQRPVDSEGFFSVNQRFPREYLPDSVNRLVGQRRQIGQRLLRRLALLIPERTAEQSLPVLPYRPVLRLVRTGTSVYMDRADLTRYTAISSQRSPWRKHFL